MAKTFIGVRDVDEETFRKFRARAMEDRMKLGEALTHAMRKLMEAKKEIKPNLRNILKIRPIKIGRKVKWSEEIDEILYGWKR